jgi:outer membrane protein TolC
MLQRCRKPFVWFALGAAVALSFPAFAADPPQPGTKPAAGANQDAEAGFGEYTPPTPTIKPRTYTLAECLSLADRNHPNLWAARSRLAFVHAQLEEAKWTPWFAWSATLQTGVAPQISGTSFYTLSAQSARNVQGLSNLTPFLTFDINGTVPLYTFGKITSIREAAEANVRVSEWDSEKARQQARMDVRRAYYGLQMARDGRYFIDEVIKYIDKGIEGMKDRLAKDEKGVSEVDRLRLEVFKEEIVARSGEAKKGEAFAMAALRFMTGIQTAFDIPDEPLKKPDRPLVALSQYLSAARLFRPEINMARAGIAARKGMVDYNRAKFFPDFGLGVGASYASFPSAVPQNNAWVNDPFNHFYYYFGFGARWNLDFLPNAARVAQAEAQLEETRALERLALSGAMVEVEKAYADADEARAREAAWDRAEHKAKQWIATAQDNIDLGTWDERALTEPLRVWGNARASHLQALMDYNIAMSQLALVSGWDSAAPTGE